jgi:hypothetical protein
MNHADEPALEKNACPGLPIAVIELLNVVCPCHGTGVVYEYI